MKRRIVVTGASGLLGSAVVRQLGCHADVVPMANQGARPGFWLGNLTEPATLERLAGESWSAIIHCAAFRSPDHCETQPEAARRLNTGVLIELVLPTTL